MPMHMSLHRFTSPLIRLTVPYLLAASALYLSVNLLVTGRTLYGNSPFTIPMHYSESVVLFGVVILALLLAVTGVMYLRAGEPQKQVLKKDMALATGLIAVLAVVPVVLALATFGDLNLLFLYV